MTHLRHEYPQLFELLDRIRDGTLDDHDSARLQSLLRNDATARSIYLQYFNLVAGLHWDRSADDRLAEELSDAPPVQLKHAQTSSLSNRIISAITRPVAWSILAVAILFYGTFALISWNLRLGKFPRVSHANDVPVAVVTKASGVRWSSGIAPKVNDSPILPGESLKIDSGVVELQLNRGVRLLVEGPAEWTVDGDNNASLRLGKLVARVSPNAVGFTLDTPTTRVVDLGTEFGVAADKHGSTDVQVFDGQVEVQSAGSPRYVKPLRLAVGGRAVVSKRGGVPVVQRPPNQADLRRYEWARSSMPGVARQIQAAKTELEQVPIALDNATATFSQSFYGGGIATTIDHIFVASNGWAISDDDLSTQSETGVWETTKDVRVNSYTITLAHLDTMVPQGTIGKFRVSVTTDDRDTFADGKATDGDVTANWIELTPTEAHATNGVTLKINKDKSILASGTNPDTSIYTVKAVSPLLKVTGIRLEVLADDSLPQDGPGRNTGNFVLTEFQVKAMAVPEQKQ